MDLIPSDEEDDGTFAAGLQSAINEAEALCVKIKQKERKENRVPQALTCFMFALFVFCKLSFHFFFFFCTRLFTFLFSTCSSSSS